MEPDLHKDMHTQTHLSKYASTDLLADNGICTKKLYAPSCLPPTHPYAHSAGVRVVWVNRGLFCDCHCAKGKAAAQEDRKKAPTNSYELPKQMTASNP